MKVNAKSLLMMVAVLMAGNLAMATGPAPVIDGVVETTMISLSAGDRQVIHHADASYIKIHFSDLYLQPGDRVTVASPDGSEVYTYSGADIRADQRGLWALSVDGDTAVVTLSAKGSADQESIARSYASVTIDQFKRGFPNHGKTDPAWDMSKSICGSTDYRNVSCYQSSDPTAYARSTPVAKLVFSGGQAGLLRWLLYVMAYRSGKPHDNQRTLCRQPERSGQYRGPLQLSVCRLQRHRPGDRGQGRCRRSAGHRLGAGHDPVHRR
jgi:hypothetical protein